MEPGAVVLSWAQVLISSIVYDQKFTETSGDWSSYWYEWGHGLISKETHVYVKSVPNKPSSGQKWAAVFTCWTRL